MKSFFKKPGFIKITLSVILALSISSGHAMAAISRSLVINNGIVFYDICGDSSRGPTYSAVTGSTNEEKVWNYFMMKGLSPVAAAGAMGNMVQESSSFDPWAGENGNTSIDKSLMGVGFGIIQWTNTKYEMRRENVMTHLENSGIPLNATDGSMMDKALIAELDWLWDGERGGETWQAALNAETTVDGDPSKLHSEDNTSNGSAMLFHSLIEKSGDDTIGKQERIDSAKMYLEKFAGSGNGSGSLTGSHGLGAICLDFPGGGRGGDSNWQDPNSLIDAFMAQVGPCGSYGGYSWGWNGCTILTLWFINEFTTLTYGRGDGGAVVNNLASANPGLSVTDFPVAPAIFSSSPGYWHATSDGPGHTGIVVSVEGNTATVIDTWASICNQRPNIVQFEIPYDTSKVRFANVGDYLK